MADLNKDPAEAVQSTTPNEENTEKPEDADTSKKQGKAKVKKTKEQYVEESLNPSDFKNNFVTGNIPGKRLLHMSEVEVISVEMLSHLKKLTGRDPCNAQKKYVQETITFCFWGNMVLTTNKSPSALITNAPLRDRFLLLEFKRFVKNEDETVLEQLIKNSSALINWSLQITREESQLMTRAGKFNLYLDMPDSPILYFIKEYLVFEKGAYVSIEALVSKFNEMKDELGTQKKITPDLLGKEIVSFSKSIWGKMISHLKKNDRPYFYLPEEAAKLIQKSSDYTSEQKKVLTSDDFYTPLISCTARNKLGKRYSVIAGMRARLPSEERLVSETPVENEPQEEIEVDPFAYVDNPNSVWSNLKESYHKRVDAYKAN
ncbi:MAG: hypothetical protein LQ351_008170, partial [Letrouitia transgressa]